MLTEEQKQKIEALPTEEMAYEIQLDNASRFQREKFTYLKVCYQKRKEAEKQKVAEPWHSTSLGKIAIGVIVVVLGAGLLWLINQYLHINLQG